MLLKNSANVAGESFLCEALMLKALSMHVCRVYYRVRMKVFTRQIDDIYTQIYFNYCSVNNNNDIVYISLVDHFKKEQAK